MDVEIEIARPRREVIAWWMGFTDDYTATDPREQPFRIQLLERTPERIALLSHFRVPLGIKLKVPQTIIPRPDGNFRLDVALPLGMEQVDEFVFVEEGHKTRVKIAIDIRGVTLLGKLMVPLYMASYALPIIPGHFRNAGRVCEQNAPRLDVAATDGQRASSD